MRTRDAQAWQRLAQLYTPLVYRWCRIAGLQSDDASDIVQEVFRSVSKNIDQFRHDRDKDSFRGWLWTITKNEIRAHFRRLAKRPSAPGGTDALLQLQQIPEPDDEITTPSGFQADVSLAHRAMQIVRTDFGEQTWQAFWRLTVEEHPVADIAADLGISSGAVRQAKYRVLCRLRECLADD